MSTIYTELSNERYFSLWIWFIQNKYKTISKMCIHDYKGTHFRNYYNSLNITYTFWSLHVEFTEWNAQLISYHKYYISWNPYLFFCISSCPFWNAYIPLSLYRLSHILTRESHINYVEYLLNWTPQLDNTSLAQPVTKQCFMLFSVCVKRAENTLT